MSGHMPGKPDAAWTQAVREISAIPLRELKGDLYQLVKARAEEIRADPGKHWVPTLWEIYNVEGALARATDIFLAKKDAEVAQ